MTHHPTTSPAPGAQKDLPLRLHLFLVGLLASWGLLGWWGGWARYTTYLTGTLPPGVTSHDTAALWAIMALTSHFALVLLTPIGLIATGWMLLFTHLRKRHSQVQ